MKGVWQISHSQNINHRAAGMVIGQSQNNNRHHSHGLLQQWTLQDLVNKYYIWHIVKTDAIWAMLITTSCQDIVATHIRCDWIFNNIFIPNSLLISQWKHIRKLNHICLRYCKNEIALLSWDTTTTTTTKQLLIIYICITGGTDRFLKRPWIVNMNIFYCQFTVR